MSANPHANGGILLRDLGMPDFRAYAVDVPKPGAVDAESTRVMGGFLRDVMRANAMRNFRVVGPDETASNRLEALFEVTEARLDAEFSPSDDALGSRRPRHGSSERAPLPGLARRVSAHRPARFLLVLRSVHAHHRLDVQPACEMAEGDARTSRGAGRSPRSTICSPRTSGVRTTTASAIRIPASSITWSTRRPTSCASICRPTRTRCSPSPITACAAAITSTSSSPASSPSRNGSTWMRRSGTARRARHLGLGEQRRKGEPDVVMACCGDVPTLETLAAVDLLRKHFPDLKIRVVNVVDLMTLQPKTEHPHGIEDREFDSLFTTDKPVVFAFHGYPWLIHRLTYRRTNHANLHVRGYKEEGTTTTPVRHDRPETKSTASIWRSTSSTASSARRQGRARQTALTRPAGRPPSLRGALRRRHAVREGLDLDGLSAVFAVVG